MIQAASKKFADLLVLRSERAPSSSSLSSFLYPITITHFR